MAIVIESLESEGWQGIDNGSAITNTKPTGLAVGDLMIAVIAMIDEDSTGLSCNPPTDWVSIFEVSNSAAGSNGSLRILGFYKIADADDTAEVSFGFQNTSGEGAGMSSIIYRISGYGSPTNIQYAADEDNSGGGTTETFTNTLTPAFANGYLFFASVGIDSTGDHTSSGYSITTDNPTWTEDADYGTDGSLFGYFGSGNGACPNFAIASASRPQTSATGNSTVTLSNSTNYISGVMIFLPPPSSVTTSPSVIDTTVAVQEPTVTGGATVTVSSALSATTSVIAPTVSMPVDDWTNQSKNSSSWTNQNKS